MHTDSYWPHRLTGGITHQGPDRLSVDGNAGAWCGISQDRKRTAKTAPALMLLMGAFSLLMAGCSQQPSQEFVDQMNARFEQLEQKVTKLEEQNTRVDEWMSNTQSSFITIDEKINGLTQQVEKVASRPSAAVKSAPAPASASPGKKQYHTVSRGETLYSIARKYGMSVDEVRRLNSLGQNQPIQAGQKLVIAPGRPE